MSGRVRRRLLGVAAAALAAACGDVRLLSPSDLAVPLSGLHLRVDGAATGDAFLLDFQGHAFGYHRRGGRTYLRLLDAGAVAVAGRRAERNYVRPAEPEYGYRGPVDGEVAWVPVALGGSEAVPPCTAVVRLAVATLPATMSTLVRGEELRIPLAVPDPLPTTDRLHASVRLATASGTDRETTVTLELRPTGPVLRVSAELTGMLPPGLARLSLRVEWQQPARRESVPEACAPAVDARSTYRAERWLWLE